MELWIRNQNKEILQKTTALFIAHSEENIWSIIDNQNMTKYGTYKTYERALEILDEIENIIKPKVLLTRLGKVVGETYNGTVYSEPNEYEMQELSTAIYEMPKE